MIPVDMMIMHDPENGQYGDCQRACIASLLELSPEEVPHFYSDGTEIGFFRSLNSFLAEFGLFHLETMPIDFDLDQFIDKPDIYHMIYGQTERNTYHATVGLNGEIIHDPHPDRSGLDESRKDEWHFGFLVPIFDVKD